MVENGVKHQFTNSTQNVYRVTMAINLIKSFITNTYMIQYNMRGKVQEEEKIQRD